MDRRFFGSQTNFEAETQHASFADDVRRQWSRESVDTRPPGEALENERKRHSPGLSHLGMLELDFLPLTEQARAYGSLSEHARDLLAQMPVEHTEFLVCKGGLCIPTDGVLRVESYHGADYVIGHSTWERCRSRAHAKRRLATRIAEVDPHDLANEALDANDHGDPDEHAFR